MDVYHAIKTRRAVREYKSDPIGEDVINRIMDAAIWAPSALNSQNWKFYVLTGEKRNQFAKLLQPIFEQMKDTIEKNYGPQDVEIRRKLYMDAGGAPVIVVCYVEEGAWSSDTTGPAAACQNIMLAATAEELGSLFVGAVRLVKDSINEFLNEKENLLLGAILIGYPKTIPEPKPRRESRIIRMK